MDLDWKQLLKLSEQLLNQPDENDQRQLVEEFARQHGAGRAHIWLDPAAFLLPGEQSEPDQTSSLSEMGQLTAREQKVTRSSKKPYLCAFPMVAQGVLLGVLEVERPDGPPFTQAEESTFEHIAVQAAVSMQVTRQVAIKNWRFEQLNLVRLVSAQIANVLDLDELFRRVTQLIRDTFKYYYVGIFTLDTREGVLTFRTCAQAQHGGSRRQDPNPGPVQLGQGLVGQAAKTGEEILANQVDHDPRYRYIETLPETRSEVSLPLKIEGRVLGVLDVQSDQENAFHDIDMLVLRVLADNIAIAAEGARLYGDLRRRADQVSVVGEVSRAITSVLDLEPLLDSIVRVIQRRFSFPFVHLFTVHPGRRKIIYQAGSGPRSRILRREGLAYDLDDPAGIIPWVARNGKTLLANDVNAEPLYRPSELPPRNTRAELAIALVFGGETLGVLDIQSDNVNAFTEEDRFLLEALGDNISIAIRNAMMFRSERWRRQVADSLRDVAGLLSADVGQEQVLNAILTELERILPCSVAVIWLLDENNSAGDEGERYSLRVAAVHGADANDLDQAGILSPDAELLIQQALHLEEPHVRTGEDPLGPIGVVQGYREDYSSLAAPLRAGSQPLGVLAIAHPTPGRYGSEAVAMAAAFASYAAVAIENTRLYASSQEQAWVSTVMLQVAEATQSINTISELMETVVRLTPLLVGIESCAMFLGGPSTGEYELKSIYGFEDRLREELQSHQIRPQIARAFHQIQETHLPVFLHDLSVDLGLPTWLARPPQGTAIVLFPLLARGEIQGAFLVAQRANRMAGGVEAFQDQQLAILQGVVQQTAIAVENIRLLESKQEEAYVTAVLLQVAQAVVTMNNLDDILEAIVHIMPILVGIDNCLVYLLDRDRFRPSHVFSGSWRDESQLLSRAYSQGEYPILDRIYSSDAPLVLPLAPDEEDPDEWHRVQLPDEVIDPHAGLDYPGSLLMGFPLSVKGVVYGIILTQERGAASAFRERRLEILTGIAQQAAIAVQNDILTREMLGRERLEREVQLAREIQQTFLPSELPSPRGWDVDRRWRPARQVGGDFYDCFHLPDGRLALVIADVSDKGMPAALYMTVTRTLIRAAALEEDSPAAVLSRVNDLLLMDSQNGLFVTGIYAMISLKTGDVTYANAGHNLPIWIHQEGQIDRLAKGGTAMGAIEDIKLVDHHIRMQPGDCLLLFTDGVTEAFSADGELYGEDRLLESILPCNDCSSQKLLDTIDDALTKFIMDTPPSDDITLLAIHRLVTPRS